MAQRYSQNALAKYVVESDKPVAELAREVAAFLMDAGKTSGLDSLMRDVMEIRGRRKGIVELAARSAHPLTQSVNLEIELIAKRLYPNAKKVIIHEVSDESVIGGVRLQFANSSLDLTIQSKLNKLREAIA